jgi:hypothetical protein
MEQVSRSVDRAVYSAESRSRRVTGEGFLQFGCDCINLLSREYRGHHDKSSVIDVSAAAWISSPDSREFAGISQAFRALQLIFVLSHARQRGGTSGRAAAAAPGCGGGTVTKAARGRGGRQRRGAGAVTAPGGARPESAPYAPVRSGAMRRGGQGRQRRGRKRHRRRGGNGGGRGAGDYPTTVLATASRNVRTSIGIPF